MNEAEKSGGLTTIVLWVSSLGILLAGIVALPYFRSFDTQYAAGYSERAFKSLKIGDTEQSVLRLLGNPISTDDTKTFVEWIYSAERQHRFSETGQGSGTHTTVHFGSTERVERIFGARQISRGVVTFGDGQGYLSLTSDQREKLAGSSQDEIRQKFGPPLAIYEYKASKVLLYSRSPSSANYHLRMVGLDKEGKVVRIWREIYWD